MFQEANKSGCEIFIQDGHPSPNSAGGCVTWKKIGAKLISISVRSADKNPI